MKTIKTLRHCDQVKHMIAPFVIGKRLIGYISGNNSTDICIPIDITPPITTQRSAHEYNEKRQIIKRINQRISFNSELRKQRTASNLSCGAFRQIGSFSFVSFLLDKQKERKAEGSGKATLSII